MVFISQLVLVQFTIFIQSLNLNNLFLVKFSIRMFFPSWLQKIIHLFVALCTKSNPVSNISLVFPTFVSPVDLLSCKSRLSTVSASIGSAKIPPNPIVERTITDIISFPVGVPIVLHFWERFSFPFRDSAFLKLCFWGHSYSFSPLIVAFARAIFSLFEMTRFKVKFFATNLTRNESASSWMFSTDKGLPITRARAILTAFNPRRVICATYDALHFPILPYFVGYRTSD